jgi:hypothetical protein
MSDRIQFGRRHIDRTDSERCDNCGAEVDRKQLRQTEVTNISFEWSLFPLEECDEVQMWCSQCKYERGEGRRSRRFDLW